MTTSVQKSGGTSLSTMLSDAIPVIQRIAPQYVNIQRLTTLAIEAHKRPDLAQCTPASVVDFCKKCAEWGTDRIGAGGVWAVKYGQSLTPIPDWRLLIQKAISAGAIKDAFPEVIYANEEYTIERGLRPALIHKQKLIDRGEPIAVYCVYTLPDGERNFVTMTWDDVMHIKAKSKSQTGPWATDPTEMAKKTVVKRTMKLFEGKSPELANMLKVDNDVTGYDTPATRPPVSMPVPIPPSDTESSLKGSQDSQIGAQEPNTPQDDPTHASDEENIIQGEIEDVESRSGNKNGKNWTKYGIKIGGIAYGTFDKELANEAQDLKGQTVCLRFSKNGKWFNAEDLWIPHESANAEQGEVENETEEEALVSNINSLLFNLTEEQVNNIMQDAGINVEDGEAWELADTKTLKSILSMVKIAAEKRS